MVVNAALRVYDGRLAGGEMVPPHMEVTDEGFPLGKEFQHLGLGCC